MATGPTDSPKPSRPSEVRLQKFLAECGLGSRRSCETLIRAGSVAVDGVTVSRLGTRVEPSLHRVTVAGRIVQPAAARLYFAFNKPRDVLCTVRDPRGRRTFLSYFKEVQARIYPVGRLDRNSEGLLLVTNDGALAHALTHPRHEVLKTYRVWIPGVLNPEQEEKLLRGIRSDGEVLRAATVTLLRTEGGISSYEIAIGEGRNRQLRRMLAVLDFPIRRLQRVAIGPLRLGGLRLGAWRTLTPGEVGTLRHAATRAARQKA